MGEALCPGGPVRRAGPTNHQITEEVSAIQNHHCNECVTVTGYYVYKENFGSSFLSHVTNP